MRGAPAPEEPRRQPPLRRPGTRLVRPVPARRGLPVGLIAGVGALGVAAVVLVVWLLARGGGDGKKPPEDFPPPPGGKVTTPTPAGAPTFRAEWKELKIEGETPPGRSNMTTAMTYDSKRKISVLFGGHWVHMNDLWTLDLAATRWTCLQKNDPNGPEVKAGTRPGGTMERHFDYDEGNDLYWSQHWWAFDPNAGSWRKGPASIEGFSPAGGTWVDRPGWAYYPEGRGFLFWKPTGEKSKNNCAFLDLAGGKKTEALPDGDVPCRYVDGGLAYDRKNKVFVLFGGSDGKKCMDDTWTFGPVTKEWRQARPAVSPPARWYHKLVWHDKLGALVMARGAGEGKGNWLNDLWVYETAADRWTEVKPATAPPPGHSATCYDASQDAVVLFNDKGQTWTCKIERVAGTPPPPPTPAEVSPWQGAWKRMGGKLSYHNHCAAAFDTKRGLYGVVFADFQVWAYSLAADKWEQLSEPVKGDGETFPMGINDLALVYDPARDGLLAVGGRAAGTLLFAPESRKWSVLDKSGAQVPALACGGEQILRLSSGANTHLFFFHRLDRAKSGWEELKCRLPPARVYPGDAMVYDPPRKRFLLFSGSKELNDTWAYDPAKNAWTELKPLASPLARQLLSTCYDSENDLVVMHGGAYQNKLQDTWVFDAARNSWFEVTPAEKPSVGTGNIEYDPANKCCIAWNASGTGYGDPRAGEVWTLKISPAGPAKTPTPTPAGPAAFRAEWKELKLAGESPLRRNAITTNMTYDTKRRVSVLFGGAGEFPGFGYSSGNDLWTLDLAAGRWTCLQKNDPKGPEVAAGTRPMMTREHHFSYDEANDLYWIQHWWAFDPNTGRWRKAPASISGFAPASTTRPGWAYYPEGRSFLFWVASAEGGTCYYLDLVAGRCESLPAGTAPPRYVDGGLAYDRKQKVFVLFGGTPYQKPPLNDTWVFNPATREWRQVKPPVSPPARCYHKLVWHDKLGALVMAGGATDYDWKNGGCTFSSDLWVYETSADRWTEVKTATAPPPGAAATCYDASQDLLVLFNDKGQTWTCKIERVEQK